jgi:hypothetical protein
LAFEVIGLGNVTVMPATNATTRPAPQDNQLMSQRCILGFKPQLRPEWQGQDA